jgi:squalene cyclase
MEYVQHESSQIINTAWALMALIQADFQDISVIQKGIDFLISKQEPNGDWPQEGISGVFNKNCMETYTSYRNVFPIWAISRYIAKYQKQ